MQLIRTVAPAAALSTAEVRAHLRVSATDEDVLIDAMAAAVAAYLDGPAGILGRAILTQTWTVQLTSWADALVLPVEPVQSVSVAYVNTLGATVALSSALYVLIRPFGAAPFLRPVVGTAWPALGAADWPVTVTVNAGESVLPADLRVAMLMMVGQMFENREGGGEKAMADLPPAAAALLARHRRGVL